MCSGFELSWKRVGKEMDCIARFAVMILWLHLYGNNYDYARFYLLGLRKV